MRHLAVAAVLALCAACGSENLKPAALANPDELYWELVLNHHAVALTTRAPYDTLQLVAAPRNYRGDSIPGLPSPKFYSANPEQVVVTPEGRLVGLARTPTPVFVVATLATGNLTHRDSVLVNVVDTAAPPVLTNFSIHPVPPDSAKLGSIGAFLLPSDTLPARAIDAMGAPIPIVSHDSAGMLPVDFRSLDTNVAKVRVDNGVSGVVMGMRPGTVKMYASTTAFGVSKADTLSYRIGEPVFGAVYIGLFAPGPGLYADVPGKSMAIQQPEITIAAGGTVIWGLQVREDTRDTVDITFADADVPNVRAVRPVLDHLTTLFPYAPFYFCAYDCDNGGGFFLAPSQIGVARYFPVPGTYEYRSKRAGLIGRVIVVDER